MILFIANKDYLKRQIILHKRYLLISLPKKLMGN